MTNEQRNAAIKTLSEYQRIVTENLAMRGLLEILERHGAFKTFAYPGQDSSWREEVDRLVKGVAGNRVREILLPLLQQIEQAFQDSELSRLLAENPPKGPIN